MGQSADGILAYGYDIGGPEEGWRIDGIDEGELWRPEWVTDGDDGDEPDYVDDAQRHLLASIGFTETDYTAAGYFDRFNAAAALVPELVTYCSGDYPMYLLAAHHIEVGHGHIKEVDIQALAARRSAEGWDARLASALTTLGITPTDQPRPRWLLVSYWSY